MNRRKKISIGAIKLSYTLPMHDWLLILSLDRESIHIGTCGQGICFHVSFINSCLEDSVGLSQLKDLAQFQQTKVSRSKVCKAVPPE